MSHSQPVADGDVETPHPTQPVNPLKNPAYPQRVHIHERAHWQGVLRSCEDRIAMGRQKMSVLRAGPNRAAFERLYAQMLGARDQVADAVRRLPGETGDLYEEDRHRLEQAVAAAQTACSSSGTPRSNRLTETPARRIAPLGGAFGRPSRGRGLALSTRGEGNLGRVRAAGLLDLEAA